MLLFKEALFLALSSIISLEIKPRLSSVDLQALFSIVASQVILILQLQAQNYLQRLWRQTEVRDK
jgi:hypothetical protein